MKTTEQEVFEQRECQQCNGSGTIETVRDCGGNAPIYQEKKCEQCNGQGYEIKNCIY